MCLTIKKIVFLVFPQIKNCQDIKTFRTLWEWDVWGGEEPGGQSVRGRLYSVLAFLHLSEGDPHTSFPPPHVLRFPRFSLLISVSI